MKLSNYQLVEIVVLKSTSMKFNGAQSATKTLVIYQLAEFVVLKRAFIKFVLLIQQLKHTKFTN